LGFTQLYSGFTAYLTLIQCGARIKSTTDPSSTSKYNFPTKIDIELSVLNSSIDGGYIIFGFHQMWQVMI
jgi:hypothetical protein